jgi:hypothetical protein
MLAIVVAALLCADGAPKAADARSLAREKKWDELYLKFASAKPDGYGAADRKAIAEALAAAAHGLSAEDKGLAFSAADVSSRFEAKVSTLLFAAELSRAQNNNGEAADPKSTKAMLARADLAMAEADHDIALKLYERVPKTSADSAKARAGAKAARQALAQKTSAKGEVRKLEDDLAHPKPASVSVAHADETQAQSRELGLDGMRVRESSYFHFIYGGGGKDFAVRSDYEGKVLDALEEARNFVVKEWGKTRETPVDVVLYTKEEYQLHFGGSSLGRALGFYTAKKMRLSNAAEITDELRAVLVHEYTHAVVDDFVKGRPVPPWLQEGTATVIELEYRGSPDGTPPSAVKIRLRKLAQRKALPSLAMLNRSFTEVPDTMVAYNYSAAAVREMISRHGISGYLDFLEEIGHGKPFEQAFVEHYYPSLSDLDDEVKSELSHE